MGPGPDAIEPEGIFDGLSWGSIVRGAILDNVVTIVAMIPLVALLAGSEWLGEDEEAAGRAIDEATASPEFMLLALVVGLAVTAWAAWWASRRAGRLHLRHGGWTAVTSAALAFVWLLAPGAGEGAASPFWYDALSLGLMLPAGLLGGWIAGRRSEDAD